MGINLEECSPIPCRDNNTYPYLPWLCQITSHRIHYQHEYLCSHKPVVVLYLMSTENRLWNSTLTFRRCFAKMSRCHTKRRMGASGLLFVWHRIFRCFWKKKLLDFLDDFFFFFFFLKRRFQTKIRASAAMRACPSFCMTRNQAIRDLFAWHSPDCGMKQQNHSHFTRHVLPVNNHCLRLESARSYFTHSWYRQETGIGRHDKGVVLICHDTLPRSAIVH